MTDPDAEPVVLIPDDDTPLPDNDPVPVEDQED